MIGVERRIAAPINDRQGRCLSAVRQNTVGKCPLWVRSGSNPLEIYCPLLRCQQTLNGGFQRSAFDPTETLAVQRPHVADRESNIVGGVAG